MSKHASSSAPPGEHGVTFQQVDDNHVGQRLDNYLLARLKGVPKSRIYRIIRKGEVRVNKKREKPEYKLCSGDMVRIPPVRLPAAREQIPPTAAMVALLADAVLFSDEDMLVINKPSGLPVHGGTGVKTGLIEALRHMYPELDNLELVHRIDKGTSGCVLLAKNGKTLKALAAQFKAGTVAKTYHAIVAGAWPQDVSKVGAPLKKLQAQGGERFVTSSADGKRALTRFSILERFPRATLVEARPETGRTHQIRVHAQLAGHPIVGDEKYADDGVWECFASTGIKRLCLHAAALEVVHPVSGQRIAVKAPYDDRFAAALRILPQAGD